MGEEEEKMKNEEVGFKKKAPSLPPNYVSIADLRERWLQRKQEEEEEKMKNEEVGFKKKAPSLPPNYVSIADLRERWLQRKREEEEGRQKAQAAESSNGENLKPVQGFFENPQNSKNRGPGIGSNRVSDRRVDSLLKGKELHGFAGANGMGKSVHGVENKERNYNKKYQWVKNGQNGEGKTYGTRKIEGEEDSDRIQGGNRGCNGSIEGTASVCMVAVVAETVSKEFKPEKLIRKSDGNMRRYMKNLRNNNGDCGVEADGSKGKVKVLPENAMRKEDLGVLGVNKFSAYGDELEQTGGGDVGDCMVEVVLENKVKEGALVGTGSGKGSEQIGSEVDSYGVLKTEGEEDSDRIQGGTRGCNGSIEGTASTCMVAVVSETVSEKFKPEKLIRKSGGNMGRDMKNLRNNGDCGIQASDSKDKGKGKGKVLPENATRKENLGVFRVKKFSAYGDELEQNGGGNDDDCTVEVVHENKVKEGALVGTGSSTDSEQFGGEVEIHGVWKTEGEEDSDRIQGGTHGCNGSIEGTTSACMVAFVSETVSEKFKPEKLIRKSSGNMRRDMNNLRNNGDCGVLASGSKDKVKILPENAMRKENLGVFRVKKFSAYGDELEQNGGGNDDDCTVEVVHENEVKERALVGTGSSKDSEQFGGEIESYRLGKIEGEEESDRIQGPTQGCNGSIEGTTSVYMMAVVSETVSKKFKPEKLIRKSGGNMWSHKKNMRNNGDCGVEASSRKDKLLPEIAMRKEDLEVFGVNKFPAYGDELEQNGGGDVGDCMVEVVDENKVKEGALVGTGSSKGSEQFSGEVEKKGMKLKVSKDKKKPQVEAMLKGVEDEVLIGYNGRNLQQGRRGKEVQVCRRREGVSEGSGTRITGSFRGLSLDNSREIIVTSRMGIHGRKGCYKMYGGNREMQNSADNRFVWVKKGDISDTNIPEFNNSGPSKPDPPGMDVMTGDEQKPMRC